MTDLLFIVTLVAVGVLVLALAAYLLTILWILRDVRHTVGLVVFGVRSIAHRVKPVEEIVGEINGDLTGVRDALFAVVGGTPGRSVTDVDAMAPVTPQAKMGSEEE